MGGRHRATKGTLGRGFIHATKGLISSIVARLRELELYVSILDDKYSAEELPDRYRATVLDDRYSAEQLVDRYRATILPGKYKVGDSGS